MACNLETKLDSLCASGIGRLTDKTKLLQIIAQTWCDAVLNPTPPPVSDFTITLTGDGVTDYAINSVESSSGFVAIQNADNSVTTYASPVSGETRPAANATIRIWACVSLVDETKVDALTNLNVSYSALTAISFGDCSALQNLDCSYNQLTSLDVTGVATLQYLDCYSNQLTSLNVTGLTALRNLDCYSNQLTSLNVTGLTALQYLFCYSNQLTSLNVTGLTALQALVCYSNQLTSLNVTGLTALQTLVCYSNQLTSLNVTGLTALQNLYCYSNLLNSTNVDSTLVEMDANGVSNGGMDISSNAAPGPTGLTAKANLISRGWSVTTD